MRSWTLWLMTHINRVSYSVVWLLGAGFTDQISQNPLWSRMILYWSMSSPSHCLCSLFTWLLFTTGIHKMHFIACRSSWHWNGLGFLRGSSFLMENKYSNFTFQASPTLHNKNYNSCLFKLLNYFRGRSKWERQNVIMGVPFRGWHSWYLATWLG